MRIRYLLVASLLISITAAVVYIFWSEEVRYSLPTPVPVNYKTVAINTTIDLSNFNLASASAKYFHFYNPDCPCSRFNAKHINNLIEAHADSIEAYIVVPTKNDVTLAKQEFGNSLPVLVDENGELATACGVYSTPQAVIIDQHAKLYYRGNYNQARYCTSRATNYAELALVSLINGAKPPVFDLLATESYGCSWQSSNQISFNN